MGGGNPELILGLDIGASSIGWALVEADQRAPVGIRAAGVRVFTAGVEGDIAAGRDKSRGLKRTAARQARKQIDRRARRHRKLAHTLRKHGLLPDFGPVTSEGLKSFFDQCDRELRDRFRETLLPDGDDVAHQVFFYRLRALALEQDLEPHVLGRLLYQFGQRRGFKSNRKSDRKKDEESDKVKPAITELGKAMEDAGAPTLGAYLAKLDPHASRIRSRWVGREMYQKEFDAIWERQARANPALTDDARAEIAAVLFYQRPLKSQKHAVGECDLIPHRKRAPLACREAQRFRVLQAVNHLRIETSTGLEREPTSDERKLLIDRLTTGSDLTFVQARKLLKETAGKDAKFNLERSGEKRLVGNRTDSKLRLHFGAERWDALAEEERDAVAHAVLTIEDAAALRRKAEQDWGLSAAGAAALAEETFEPGYAAFSRQAIQRMLPRLEEGLPVEVVRREVFPESVATRPPVDRLAPVETALPALSIPSVRRSLTELRKVVNAIVRVHGRPDVVRIELARDLRNSRQKRQDMSKQNRSREQERERARDEIRKLGGPKEPSRADVEKYLLGEECGWQCPYTGRQIDIAGEFGGSPQFDIEHIWPLSRSLDDSFVNKTLCWHEENRSRKKNRMPYEAYGTDSQRMMEILDRVTKFRGRLRMVKLSRFASEEIPGDFTERHLQDTRNATRQAMKYLAQLYGGTVDAAGRRRIQAGTGGLTAIVRGELGLNRILDSDGVKSRNDHRHHAVDALAVAVIGPALVQQLQTAAADAEKAKRRRFAPITPPWESFVEDVRKVVDEIVISHRTQRNLSGPLHKETNYARPQAGGGTDKKGGATSVRKFVFRMSESEIERIVDQGVRRAVLAKLDALGGTTKKNIERLETDPPVLESSRPPRVIRRARIEVRDKVTPLSKSLRERFVQTEANHHLSIFAVLDEDGGEVAWETGELVTLLEARQRLMAGEPIVRREAGPGKKFKFSLSAGDLIEMRDGQDRGQLMLVRGVWIEKGQGRIEVGPVRFAGKKEDAKALGLLKKPSVSRLFKAKSRKVVVDPLGRVFTSGD